MPSRRAFLTASLAVVSAPAWPQDKERVFRIGMLDVQPAATNVGNLAQFQKGMKELGYNEGRNFTSEYRADATGNRFGDLAAMLAQKKVDVLVTRSTPATLAAKNLAGAIPVIAAGVADPVETKLVESMEKPGGKVTGIGFTVKELESKRIDVLRALAPGRKRVVALLDMSNPAIAETWRYTEESTRALGMQAEVIDVRRSEDVMKGFDAAVNKQAELLVVRLGSLGDMQRRALVDAIARQSLPAIYGQRLYVDAGGLVSYGVSTPYLYYRAAWFVDKILKGAKPAELPMERPSKFELVINRKTLRALNLVVPPDLLLRSDEII